MLMLVGFAMVLLGFSESNVYLLCWDTEGQRITMWLRSIVELLQNRHVLGRDLSM